MERECEPIRFSTKDGSVYICQEVFGRHDENSVRVPLDQIDLLIGWLQEAKKELGQGDE